MNIKKKAIYIMESLLVLLMLVFSGSVFFVTGYNKLLTYLLFLVTGALALVYICKNYNKPFDKTLVIMFVLIGFLFVNYLVYQKENLIQNYVGVVLKMLFAYFVVNIIKWERFRKHFINYMLVFGVFIIVFSLLKNTSLYNVLMRPLASNTIDGGDRYVGFLFYYDHIYHDRMSGFFWEPGILATMNIFATLLIEFSGYKRKYLYQIFFLSMVVISKSTAGIILMVFVVALLIFNRANTMQSKIASLIAMMVLFITLIAVSINLDRILYAFNLTNDPVYAKLLSDNLFNSERVNAVRIMIETIIKNPLLGVGYDGEFYNPNFLACTVKSTPTMFRVFAMYGLVPGLIYNVAIFRGLIRNKDIQKITKLFLIIIVVCILNKEPHDSMLFTSCIIFYMNRSNRIPKRELKNEIIAN